MFSCISFLKVLLFILIMIFSSMLGYYLYLKWPTGVDVELSRPVDQTIQSLIVLADKEKKINPDPYASSRYRPNDTLYDPVLAIQQGNWAKAEQLLKPMVDKGNATAMFWLAEITYRSSAFSGSGGAALFEKSAKLGNPYAALRLSPKYNQYQCEMRMSSYCDDSWSKIGIDLLAKRASSGDLSAQYALLYYARFDNADEKYFYEFINTVKEGMNENYFRPLRHLISMYLKREHSSLFDSSVNPLSEKDKKELLKLLFYAADNNDIDSLNVINKRFKNVLSSERYLNQSVGRNLSVLDNKHFVLTFDYFVAKGKEHREFVVQGYAVAKLFATYEGNEYGILTTVYQDQLEKSGITALTDDEKKNADLLYQTYLNKQKPVIYIDEISGAWGDVIY